MDRSRIPGLGVSLEHNEEKVNLPKESPIIGKHKHQKLRRKLAIGRKNIMLFLKSFPNAIRAGHSGKRKLRPKRYNTKRY